MQSIGVFGIACLNVAIRTFRLRELAGPLAAEATGKQHTSIRHGFHAREREKKGRGRTLEEVPPATAGQTIVSGSLSSPLPADDRRHKTIVDPTS